MSSSVASPGGAAGPFRSRGEAIIGGLLVAMGVVLLLGRLHLVEWDARWVFWPAILIGVGLARFVDSLAGGPYRGLLPVMAGVWLLAVQGGWLALDTSWPLLVVALGLAIVAGGVKRPYVEPAAAARSRGWHLTPLAVAGLWVAVILAARTPGLGSYTTRDAGSGSVYVFTLTGESVVRPAPPFRQVNVITLMGRTRLDVEDAGDAAAEPPVVNLFTMWGRTEVRVPEGWHVAAHVTPVLAQFKDQRTRRDEEPPGTSAVRLAVRGLVAMGEVVVVN